MKEIKEILISFKTAKLAKEKGFDCKTQYYYDFMGSHCSELNKANWNISLSSIYSKSTQSHLQQWLREKHNYHITLTIDWNDNRYDFDIFHWSKNGSIRFIFGSKGFKDYAKTLEKALHDTLILIKQ